MFKVDGWNDYLKIQYQQMGYGIFSHFVQYIPY